MNETTTISLNKDVKEQLERAFKGKCTWSEFLLELLDKATKFDELIERSAEGSKGFEAAGLAAPVNTTQQKAQDLSSLSGESET